MVLPGLTELAFSKGPTEVIDLFIQKPKRIKSFYYLINRAIRYLLAIKFNTETLVILNESLDLQTVSHGHHS